MALTQIRKEQILSVDPATLSTQVPVGKGGTGISTVSAGDILYADASDSIAAAAPGSTSGVQAHHADLDNLSGMVTGASSALALLTDTEVEILDGATVSTAELNHSVGVTSAIQTQLDSMLELDGTDTMTGNLNMGTNSIIGVVDPVNAQDAATKNYVDALSAGLSWKESVKAATSANITLSGDSQTIDGISIGAGDRVLVKAQTDGAENGIYVAASGAWSRSLDMDENDEFSGSAVFVEQGTASGDQGYVCTNDGDITIGSTAVSWTQFTGTGAFNFRSGLTAAGNAVDVAFRNEVFPGSDFDDGNIDTSFPVSFLEDNSGASDHFNGMSAPKTSTNDDAGRQNYPISVFLNGILLSTIKLASNATEPTIEDFLAGTNVSNNNPDSMQLDAVILLSDASSAFKLYLNQADILDDDLVTLSYAL